MSNMKRLKPLAPRVCPQCQGEKTFVVTPDKIECSRCGYVVRGQDNRPQPPPKPEKPKPKKRELDLSQYRLTDYVTHPGGVMPYAESVYSTAIQRLREENIEEAIKELKRCLEYEEDFSDAHLWLGRLLEDPAERRHHITSILALNASHSQALHELMIIDGEISGETVYDEYRETTRMSVGGAVSVSTENIRCPQCGSANLTDDEASGTLYCESCGYRQSKMESVKGGMASFSKAILKRRLQEVKWQVGERLLQCNSCGAKRTIHSRHMTQTCPFCGSNHVIKTDALSTFQQPDGIIPFDVPERAAIAIVEKRLESRMAKLKSVFRNNRYERLEIEGVFLPFWMYDTVLEVIRTVTDHGTSGTSTALGLGLSMATGVPTGLTSGGFNRSQSRRDVIADAMNNIAVSGVTSPPRQLTDKLGRYSLRKAVHYTPKLLAQHAAEIYEIDFDDASMTAHDIISKTMREKHEQVPVSSDRDIKVSIFPIVKSMTFTLLLKPVWSVTIFEVNGNVRPALVNGQTGAVVFGKSQKPDAQQ